MYTNPRGHPTTTATHPAKVRGSGRPVAPADHNPAAARAPKRPRRAASAAGAVAVADAAAASAAIGVDEWMALGSHEWDAIDALYGSDHLAGGAVPHGFGTPNGHAAANGHAANGAGANGQAAKGAGANGHHNSLDQAPGHPIIAAVVTAADAPVGDEGDPTVSGEMVRRLSTDDLFGRCRVPASEARYRWHFDEAVTYELLRRACHDEDERARACVKGAFGEMVASSIACYDGWENTVRGIDELVDLVFDQAWRRLRPEKFIHYRDFKPLLLLFKQTIPYQVVTDELRRRQRNFEIGLPESDDARVFAVTDTQTEEADPFGDIARGELRQHVLSRAKTPQERVLLQHKWFGDRLKPAELLAKFPKLFRDTQHIYRTDENLLLRLRRDPELSQLFERILGYTPKRSAAR